MIVKIEVKGRHLIVQVPLSEEEFKEVLKKNNVGEEGDFVKFSFNNTSVGVGLKPDVQLESVAIWISSAHVGDIW